MFIKWDDDGVFSLSFQHRRRLLTLELNWVEWECGESNGKEIKFVCFHNSFFFSVVLSAHTPQSREFCWRWTFFAPFPSAFVEALSLQQRKANKTRHSLRCAFSHCSHNNDNNIKNDDGGGNDDYDGITASTKIQQRQSQRQKNNMKMEKF